MAHADSSNICALVDEMTSSVASVREAIRCLNQNRASLDLKDGISLLSLKHHMLLSYLQSLLLLSSRRAIGHALCIRTPPPDSFSTLNRSSRGYHLGDNVDLLAESRIVFEKIRTMEARMRYQIEKLVRVAGDPERELKTDDPLAFRPNPQNLVNDQQIVSSDVGRIDDSHYDRISGPTSNDDIYHPPRVAPVPYTEKSKSQKRKERPPLPSALASLSSDPSRPHLESTTGLGSTPSLASGRAAYLKRLSEFEEENFSRIIMKKSDAKRRARDEEDLALGGSLGGGSGTGRRRAGGLEDEFGDVLKSVSRVGTGVSGGKGDGYDELRNRGKRGDVLERSRKERVRTRQDAFGDGEENQIRGQASKRSRFELETKVAKKKLSRRRNP
ncbi:Neuroguidin [Hypsizygus marmoreus]|uniref:Neuroguidin n=1 Tax=Hypsizygus marmoreus TaxID=39966 RepID=A0A369JPE3_HYPMA|nr:Neuroguidin [Hypsizygus marmoreus]